MSLWTQHVAFVADSKENMMGKGESPGRTHMGNDTHRPVRLKDIAKNLGLSIGTVQKALCNQGGCSEETRQRILAEAERLGYKANRAASSLRRGTIDIAVVLPAEEGMNSFFYTKVWNGIKKAAMDFSVYNINLIEHHCDDEVSCLRSFLEAEEFPFDGIITEGFDTPSFNELANRFYQMGIPLFFINGYVYAADNLRLIPDSSSRSGAVAADIFHTITAGRHGTILLVGGDRTSGRQYERSREFRETMAEYNRDISIIEAYYGSSLALYEESLKTYFNDISNLIGAYAVSSRSTYIMCRAIESAGLSGKITAVGTDVFEELVPYFDDGTLTASIYQYPVHRGYLAVQSISRSIMGQEVGDESLPMAAVFRHNAREFSAYGSALSIANGFLK